MSEISKNIEQGDDKAADKPFYKVLGAAAAAGVAIAVVYAARKTDSPTFMRRKVENIELPEENADETL
jgi:hypothetical protein